MSDSIQILPASTADLPTIVQFEKELNAALSWSQKTFENYLKDENHWVWVAKKEGIIAGYLVCQVIGDEAELHDIAVSKDFRRQGIGRQLLEHLKSELKKKQVRKLFLLVRQSNIGAQTLYQLTGFRPVGTRRNYYSNPTEDAQIFCRELK